MEWYADLHLHSRFSRSTSPSCDLEHLALWAQKKGLALLATGDCLHAGWNTLLRTALVPATPGLFRLRPEVESSLPVPASCRSPVHFILSTEIATIYRWGDKTRKIHQCVYFPDFDSVERFRAVLARVGNLDADGRPILGMDSRDLLEALLDVNPDNILVPAHIWTPWFAMLGSRSGFDSLEDCYRDLAGHIPAVETGLSSDPPMNWRVSSLDPYQLISNSDAHSPGNMGRNATIFTAAMDYYAVRKALFTGQGLAGTIEFFPEKGKYHFDGHRKCHICWHPRETRRHDGQCPVCGKKITVGVLARVEELADRPEGASRPQAKPFQYLVPLKEILSELEETGPQSKRVSRQYEQLLQEFGPELVLLKTVPVEDIARQGAEMLSEALCRMRSGNVTRIPGYDGEYGHIYLFPERKTDKTGAV